MKVKFNFSMGTLPSEKKDMMNKAAADAEDLLNAAANYQVLFHNKWLGSGISPTDVQAYTGRVVKLANEVLITLAYQYSTGSFAWCNAEKYRGKQAFGAAYDFAPQVTMMFCTNYFHDKVSRGERAQTMLHELTHLALATTDEKVKIGAADVDCYGDYCQELIKQAPDRAKQNADNWGFYLASYRSGLGWSEADSRYLEVDDIAAARGKRF